MTLEMDGKAILGKVECLGKSRDTFEKSLNDKYGEENWGYGWLVEVFDEELQEYVPTLFDREEVIGQYLSAYVLLAAQMPWIFHSLVEVAAEVFEVDPVTDLVSDTDFGIQSSSSTHYMDIALRCVVEQLGLTFKGMTNVHINLGGDNLPANVASTLDGAKTWFDVFNPSKLPISSGIRPHSALHTLQLLTNPCDGDWAPRLTNSDTLTAESLYQFTRVVWVKK